MVPVAAGFLDGPVLRVTAAPGADLGALAADAEELLEPGNDWSDGLPVPGWELEQEEPWLVMSWTPRPVSSRAEPVGEAGAADRVLVQRSAFAGSTFTVERWHTMKRAGAGCSSRSAPIRTIAGTAMGAMPCLARARLSPIGVRARSPSRHHPQTTPRWRSIDRPGSPSCASIAIGFALDELEQRTHLAPVEPAVPAHAQVAQLDRADGRAHQAQRQPPATSHLNPTSAGSQTDSHRCGLRTDPGRTRGRPGGVCAAGEGGTGERCGQLAPGGAAGP